MEVVAWIFKERIRFIFKNFKIVFLTDFTILNFYMLKNTLISLIFSCTQQEGFKCQNPPTFLPHECIQCITFIYDKRIVNISNPIRCNQTIFLNEIFHQICNLFFVYFYLIMEFNNSHLELPKRKNSIIHNFMRFSNNENLIYDNF